MDRRVLVSAMMAFVLTMGCATARAQTTQPSSTPAPVAQGEPKPEKAFAAGLAQIWIDKNAQPEFEAVTIEKGKTDVLWYGRDGVKHLLIAFKPRCPGEAPPPRTPPDPTCNGRECALDKVKHQYIEGRFCYAVVVVRDDGSVKSVDPRLIINP